MPLSPYLSFAGNCADAIAYYQQTLGAELLYKLSFGEMPPRRRITKRAARQEYAFPILLSPTPTCVLPAAIS